MRGIQSCDAITLTESLGRKAKKCELLNLIPSDIELSVVGVSSNLEVSKKSSTLIAHSKMLNIFVPFYLNRFMCLAVRSQPEN